jgi:hypothetical protein
MGAREPDFPLYVAGQRLKIFLALIPSAVHLDPLTVSESPAFRILRAGLLRGILSINCGFPGNPSPGPAEWIATFASAVQQS